MPRGAKGIWSRRHLVIIPVSWRPQQMMCKALRTKGKTVARTYVFREFAQRDTGSFIKSAPYGPIEPVSRRNLSAICAQPRSEASGAIGSSLSESDQIAGGSLPKPG